MEQMEEGRVIAMTGATGFVGRHVVRRLLEEPDIVLRCLVRPGSELGPLGGHRDRIKVLCGDVGDSSSLTPLLEGAWGAINLAGYRDFWSRDRDLYYRLNTRGAENVFRAALDAKIEKVCR